MRILLAFAAIGITFMISYLNYCTLKENAEFAQFLKELSIRLQKNSHSEMESFFKIFNSTYKDYYNYDVNLNTADEILGYIEEKTKLISGSQEAIKSLKTYQHAGIESLDNAEKKMIEAFDDLSKKADAKLINNGKSSLIIYPMLCAMGVIILI